MVTKEKPKAKAKKSNLGHPKERYLKWYKDMLLIRKFEEKTGQLYIQQKFEGFCHLYIGQEAVVADQCCNGENTAVSVSAMLRRLKCSLHVQQPRICLRAGGASYFAAKAGEASVSMPR